MKYTQAREILKNYNKGLASAHEEALIEAWLTQYQVKKSGSLTEQTLNEAKVRMWLKIEAATQSPIKPIRLWPRVAVAAAIFIVIGLGLWWLNHEQKISKRVQGIVVQNDIAPGHNGATLTLANGTTIDLNGQKNGIVIEDKVIKYIDGSSIPENSSAAKGNDQNAGFSTQKVQWDNEKITATTAKGQNYAITLQDGTKVWLNADSKLEFLPNYKNSSQRLVKLSGEAYFQVSKNKKQPFIVQTNKQLIKVLGTHFNVDAYEKEIKTTLIEGSVQVSLIASEKLNTVQPSIILQPGQQSELSEDDRLRISSVDVEAAIAWKSGYFMFDHEDLTSILKRVARWYDVDIVYTDYKLGKLPFSGSVSRFKNISSLLKQLENAGQVKFQIRGRYVLVMKPN